MAEKGAFNKGFRQGSAIHNNKIIVLSIAVFVYGRGKELLACACFACNKDIHIAHCGLGHLVKTVPYLCAFAYYAFSFEYNGITWNLFFIPILDGTYKREGYAIN
jgi:hypothetical protein